MYLYTVIGLVNKENRELLVAAVYEGDPFDTPINREGPEGYDSWVGVVNADDVTQAKMIAADLALEDV